MIVPTVLHNGYIMQEIEKAADSARYHELCHLLMAWHSIPGHDDEEPPQEVTEALAELKRLKLHAFAQAGRLYRLALEAYQQRCDFERQVRLAGFPVIPDTAIQYVDGPKPPIELNFDHPA